MPRHHTRLQSTFWLLSLVVWSTAARPAAALQFTDLFVFGDSLSDVGNVAQIPFVNTPGPYYYQGRFSNGPNYVDALAAGLGLPPSAPLNGGNNFAYGGAKTTGTGGFVGLFLRDVDEQVDYFIDNRTAEPDDLFVVFAGANDFIGATSYSSGPVTSLASDLDRLVADGVRHLLVPNLPPLGNTPRYNGNSASTTLYNSLSAQFNTALDATLDSLEAVNPALSIYRFDTESLFIEARNNPAAFGFTNVTDPAAPGLEPGATFYDTSLIVDEPDQYLFWDDLHPTTAVHAILAARMLDLLLSTPGDINGDGLVSIADYTALRDGLGADYTQNDYIAWRTHYGEGEAAAAHAATVPEPTSCVLFFLGAVLVVAASCRQVKRVNVVSYISR